MVSKKRKNSEDDKKKEACFESDPYELKFPLPEQLDPSQCRDEFISTIIKEHEIRASSLRPRSMVPDASDFESLQEESDQGSEKGAEAMVVRQLVTQRRRGSLRKTKEEILENIRLRSTMMTDLNLKCQKAAIEFLSVRLLKQLRLFSSPWPGDTGDIPYNLFSWSMDDFLMRVCMKQVYLDVINRERSAEDLDCLKFCKDLGQIELLIHEIREDYRLDRDLCQNSMELLKSAQYNTNAPWVNTLNDNLESMKSSSLTAKLFAQSSTCNIVLRHSSAMVSFESESGEWGYYNSSVEASSPSTAQDPIEMRYQINWIRSCTDQRLFRINGREEKMRKELLDLELQALQDETVRNSSELIYSLEVGKLRESVRKWQEKLDTDLENADVMCTVSRLALQKVRDDIKFYREQRDMYLKRIAEVQDIIDEEAKQRNHGVFGSESRLSRRSVRISRSSERKSERKSQRNSVKVKGRKSERLSERRSERKSRNSKVQ